MHWLYLLDAGGKHLLFCGAKPITNAIVAASIMNSKAIRCNEFVCINYVLTLNALPAAK